MMFFNSAVLVLIAASVIDQFAQVSTTKVNNNVSLIVSAPLNDSAKSGDTREWPWEILSAAQAAVDGINNDSSILPNYDLRLIPLDSCTEDENEIVQQFVNISYYQPSKNIQGLTGFFSHRALSLMLPLAIQKGIIATLPSEIFVYHGRCILAKSSLTTMASVLLTFMKRMTWERFGLITESKDLYFFNMAASLLQRADINKTAVITPYIELQHGLEAAIHEIISYNTKVIIVSLPAQRAAEMISLISETGLLWPNYAWIFFGYGIEDFRSICNDLDKAISGIFMIQSQIRSNTQEIKLNSNSLANASFKHNGLANVIYDLVMLTALKLNENHSYQSISDTDQVSIIDYNDDTIFSIFHIWGWTKVLIGTVYSNLSITVVNETVLQMAPNDDLPVANTDPPTGYTVVVVFLIILLTIFVTLTLLLYICFRKEPEIKATSFTISLFLFTGCYINLLYMILLVYFDHGAFNAISPQHQNAVCNLLQWFSGSGISLPLTLATLLVKMLRVYHIFNYVTLRIGHYCSDLALIVYILLILAPNIIINLVWLFADQYHAVVEYNAGKGYTELSKDCNSKYESIWSGVLSAYLLILALACAAVAFLTRKVRLQHFNDTKKVNILVYILCSGILLTFSYWLLLQMLNTKPYIMSVPLIIGHSVVIFFFQLLLFIPKVFPPLWRFINKKVNITQRFDPVVHKIKQVSAGSQLKSKRENTVIEH